MSIFSSLCFADPPFSQLGFDEAVKTSGRSKQKTKSLGLVDPKELLESGEILRPGQDPTAVPKKRKAKKKNKKKTEVMDDLAKEGDEAVYEEVEDLLDEARFIIPSLKGPKADRGNEHFLTSPFGWKPKRNDYCDAPLNNAQRCKKAKALKEVLNLFTGNDDFYEARCQMKCKSSNLVRRLTDVLAVNGQGDELRQVLKGGNCVFRFIKEPGNRWVVLQPKRLKCACISRSSCESL